MHKAKMMNIGPRSKEGMKGCICMLLNVLASVLDVVNGRNRIQDGRGGHANIDQGDQNGHDGRRIEPRPNERLVLAYVRQGAIIR